MKPELVPVDYENKVIAEIEGKPMIFYVIDRVKQIKSVEQIILATTQEKK